MRIITGSARGTKLFTLEGDATRPTSERVKEAVFSMIQFDIEGRSVLDPFGGSGQLVLEALSRGAASATVSDSSRAAVAIIEKNTVKTHFDDGRCEISCCDYAEALRRAERNGKKFDIVFLDPPYRAGLLITALKKLEKLLKPTSTVICESGEPLKELPKGFEVIKEAKYGVAYVTLLKPAKEETK